MSTSSILQYSDLHLREHSQDKGTQIMSLKETQKVVVYPSRRLKIDENSAPVNANADATKYSVSALPSIEGFQNNCSSPNVKDENKWIKEICNGTYNEKESLKEQLETQLKINADLKKLLVASIGDDLHNKVETLIRTKAQLTLEINMYTDKLLEDHESIDKLSILVDVWYSKFQASRLLISQLTSDRDTLLNLYLQCKNALQYTIDERQYLYKVLSDTNRLLFDSMNKLIPREQYDVNVMNTLELAEFNKTLAERLNPMQIINQSTTIPNQFTYAEQLANEVINIESNIMLNQNEKLLPRFHPKTKYYGVTFNCCKNCKGTILIV